MIWFVFATVLVLQVFVMIYVVNVRRELMAIRRHVQNQESSEELFKSVGKLHKKEDATSRLVNYEMSLFRQHIKEHQSRGDTSVSDKQIKYLEEIAYEFWRAYGTDVDAFDRASGPVQLSSLYDHDIPENLRNVQVRVVKDDKSN